jgi:hypothetical protein
MDAGVISSLRQECGVFARNPRFFFHINFCFVGDDEEDEADEPLIMTVESDKEKLG